MIWSAAACRRSFRRSLLPTAAASRGHESGAKAPHSRGHLGVSYLAMKRSVPLLALVLLAASADASILRIRVNDMIHPISDEYIGRGLASAAQAKDAAVVIELTTPGGLIDSTRSIVEKMMTSKIPVIV